MKDINDAQTIDWVDEVEVVGKNKILDDTINSLLITPTVNPAWREVITKLVEQTINDIENQQEQQP